MGSLMKMFKTNKKHGNKENLPSVTFNTNSLKPSKSKFSDQVYMGEPPKNIDLRLKSPYAVITAPKTTRGPRSCPGAPMDTEYEKQKGSNKKQLNASMFSDRKNVMSIDKGSGKEKRRGRDDFALIENRRSEFMNGRISPSQMAYRNMVARQQYDNINTYESDEDEIYEEKIRSMEARNNHLEAKVQKMHRRMNEERSTMTRQIEILQEENYRLKKSHDRMHRQYSLLKSQMETERKQKSDLLKMLHDANSKIELLEAGCDENVNDESVNTSSLLCPYSGAADMERSSEGAGEALCFPETMSMTSNQPFGVFDNMTQTLIVNPMPNSLKDDMDTQDEVRIFRTGESSDRDSSPCEMRRDYGIKLGHGMNGGKKEIQHRTSAITTSGEMTRSHSDSDLVSNQKEVPRIEFNPDQSIIEKEEPIYTRRSTWIKRKNGEEEFSSSSSEEERCSLIEKQLKKKGGLVKFNPPRPTVQAKHYKRFGKMERNALAEFEYLQDMSTDVSGMMSSPEVNQLIGMTNTFPPN